MRRLQVSTSVLLVLVSPASLLLAANNDNPLISPGLAQRYGLERVWFSQIRLAPGSEGIVDVRLHVSSTNAQTLFRITTDSGPTIVVSDRDLDVYGKPNGLDGAGKAAAERARLLRLQGFTAEIEQSVVPDILMYVATSSGLVQALDAETGRTLWTTSIGSMKYPTSQLAVTEDHVAVVNGQILYLLDAKSGVALEQRRIVGSPAAGPTICNDIVFVPLLNGHLVGYRVGPDVPKWPAVYHSAGSVLYSPTTADKYVVWSNNVGDITCITAGRPGVNYRLRLSDVIAGPLIYVPPKQILGVTESGSVYSFEIATGRMMWRYASGEASDEPAAKVNETVYLLTRDSGMYSLSAITGEQKWPVPFAPARQFVAASAKRVYCTTSSGPLAVLDVESGKQVGLVPMNVNDRVFANNQTDRIYVATRSGAIQCLREKEAVLPVIHATVAEEEKPVSAPSSEEPAKRPDGSEPKDPFATPSAEGGDEEAAEPGMGEDEAPADDDADRDPFGG